MKTINLSFGRKISRVRVCVRVSLSCYTNIFYSERAVGELLLLLLLYFIFFFLINISPPRHYHHRLVHAFLPTRYYYTHRHHTHTYVYYIDNAAAIWFFTRVYYYYTEATTSLHPSAAYTQWIFSVLRVRFVYAGRYDTYYNENINSIMISIISRFRTLFATS